MEFKLVRDVKRLSLEEWPAWGQYYMPSDIDLLANHGYDRDTVRAAIEDVEGGRMTIGVQFQRRHPWGLSSLSIEEHFLGHQVGARYSVMYTTEGHPTWFVWKEPSLDHQRGFSGSFRGRQI